MVKAVKNNLFCNFFAFYKQPETVQKKKKILMLSSLRATFLKSTRYFKKIAVIENAFFFVFKRVLSKWTLPNPMGQISRL